MYLYGASGHAKVIVDILELQKTKINQIFDDNVNTNSLLGRSVIPFDEKEVNKNTPFILSIGNNKIRQVLAKKLLNFEFIKAIHPSCIIDSTSTIEIGTVVMAGVIINSSVKIGKHCIINTSTSIDHDCVIGNFSHISPNATLCGNVTIGECTQVGAGSVVIQGITIGSNVIIGAGSIIVKNIPDNVTVVGNPGRIIKKTQ